MTSSKPDGGPAFPERPDDFGHPDTPGMTLRDYFAAAALGDMPAQYTAQDAAMCAYKIADAMLAERAK